MRSAVGLPYFAAPTPIVLAHRGGAGYGPNIGIENTLAAFRNAFDLGCRYLETDVHATSDGVVVAFHDDRLDRVTDGAGVIAQLPYDVLRQARVGGREPVPTLEQLLEELPQARLNIDLKSDKAVEPTLRILQRHNAIDRVCIGSFAMRRLWRARRLGGARLATSAGQPEVAAVRLLPRRLADRVPNQACALQIPVRHTVAGQTIELVTPELVRRVHAEGGQVHVWTIDDPMEMHRLLEMGVDGLVTDRPDLALEVARDRTDELRR